MIQTKLVRVGVTRNVITFVKFKFNRFIIGAGKGLKLATSILGLTPLKCLAQGGLTVDKRYQTDGLLMDSNIMQKSVEKKAAS